ncbi:MAG: hypothetical protein K5686_11725 [Lachnospiraceae bacterium]|nr:hypothetical protein [Lachnospiraceae bacterium]
MDKKKKKLLILLAISLLVLTAVVFLLPKRELEQNDDISEEMESTITNRNIPAPASTEEEKEIELSERDERGPEPKPLVTPTPTPTPEPTPTPKPKKKKKKATPTPEPEATEFPEMIRVEVDDSILCRNMILDLDYASDVDDVAAVRIASQMHRLRRIELKAVMLSVPFEDGAKALHGQLRYEGLHNMPIGVSGTSAPVSSPFWDKFIEKYYSSSDFDKRDSVELYKEVLRDCAANNEKIRIVTTGFLVNIEKLLQDGEGYTLVDQCVEDIWITGGSYPTPGMDYNFYISEETRRAAKYVFENSPVELVYSVGQMASDINGKPILCGGTIYGMDSSDTDPIRVAYKCYEEAGGADLSKGHMSWDPMCVWAASLSASETQTRIVGVNGSFDEVGRNSFVAANNPLRGVLEKTGTDGSWYGSQLDYYLNIGYHYPEDWGSE